MRIMTSEENMKSKLFRSSVVTTFVLLLIACALPVIVAAQTQPATPAAGQGPKAFDTPQQAAEALIKAAGDYDVPELMAIFGPDGEDFIESADPVRDKNNGVAFAKEAAAKNSIELAKSNPNRATIIVGDEGVAVSGSPGEEKRQVVFQRQGRATGNPLPAHRRQRTGRHYSVSRLRRSAERICIGNSRRLRSKSVRAEDLQHPRQAGRLVLEESRRHIGRTDRRGGSQGAGRGLHQRQGSDFMATTSRS